MSEQEKTPAQKTENSEPTAEQVRLFTERLLAMGGLPGRFWP